jgi:hypothetical protein
VDCGAPGASGAAEAAEANKSVRKEATARDLSEKSAARGADGSGVISRQVSNFEQARREKFSTLASLDSSTGNPG